MPVYFRFCSLWVQAFSRYFWWQSCGAESGRANNIQTNGGEGRTQNVNYLSSNGRCLHTGTFSKILRQPRKGSYIIEVNFGQGPTPPLDCAVECAVDTRKQPVQDSKTEGRGGAIPQAGHNKGDHRLSRWPPLRFTLNQEVEGSNPSWPTSKIKGLGRLL